MNVYLYLASILTKLFHRHFGWNNKAVWARAKNLMIKLPVDSNGDPDWQYMDTYIAKLTALAYKNVSSLKEAKAKPAKLNIDHWGEFKISDIYEHIEHPVARSKKHYESGNIPFIASGAINNGIDCYLAPKNKQDIDKGNCLTISPVDGSCFYQPNDFLGRGGGGSAISILRTNKALSQATHVFLASIISHTLKEQYSFGNMGNTQKIKDTIIKLPIDAKGEPDWEYMDNQVRHFATLSDLTITSLNPAKLPIFIGEWKKFKINKLFTIQTGTDLIMRNLENGKYPLVTHSQENNGITKYISKLQNRQLYDHTRTLSVADRGTFFVAHQTSDFYIGTRVKVLIYKYFIPINDNIALFLATSINKLRDRFYNYAENATNRLPDSLIKLPVNFNGEPDWQYMDQYVSWIKQYSKNKLTLIR